jgi:hypothetical protein
MRIRWVGNVLLKSLLSLVALGAGCKEPPVAVQLPVVLDNGDFEASSSLPPPGWEVRSHATATLSYETQASLSGSRSLKIVTSDWGGGAQSVRKWKVVPGEKYKLAGYAKTDSGKLADAALLWFDAGGAPVSAVGLFATTTSSSWTLVSTSGVVPLGAVQAQVVLVCDVAGGGTVYFDNILLTRE